MLKKIPRVLFIPLVAETIILATATFGAVSAKAAPTLPPPGHYASEDKKVQFDVQIEPMSQKYMIHNLTSKGELCEAYVSPLFTDSFMLDCGLFRYGGEDGRVRGVLVIKGSYNSEKNQFSGELGEHITGGGFYPEGSWSAKRQ